MGASLPRLCSCVGLGPRTSCCQGAASSTEPIVCIEGGAGGQRGFHSRARPVTAASLSRVLGLLWGSEQQAFPHQQPGTPTEMLTCLVSTEDRKAMLGVLTSCVLPCYHFRFPVALGGRCPGSSFPHQAPGLALCHYVHSCFCLSQCSPKMSFRFDPYLNLTVHPLPSNL